MTSLCGSLWGVLGYTTSFIAYFGIGNVGPGLKKCKFKFFTEIPCETLRKSRIFLQISENLIRVNFFIGVYVVTLRVNVLVTQNCVPLRQEPGTL
jgi:hypothetical protein